MAYTPPSPDPALPPVRINLLSDTQTRPSPAMREAMACAEVGDEQLGHDPMVKELCARTAMLLGKEAAVFLPSGTMRNVAARLTHCRPGDEILAHETSHILTSEGGAHAALGGIQVFPLRGGGGQFSVPTLQAALRTPSRYAPRQTLLSAEQTANIGGGTVWPTAELAAVAATAKAAGLATHLDGARLLNASVAYVSQLPTRGLPRRRQAIARRHTSVASGISADVMATGWDSAWLDFSKGLGAPIGGVLAGSKAFIDEVWRRKQRLGGAMRQAGVCAAACLYALDHNVARLAEDHARARRLAQGLSQIAGVRVQAPDTNLVFFELDGAGLAATDLIAALRARGILITMLGGRLRACTHLDVDDTMIDETLDVVRTVMRGA